MFSHSRNHIFLGLLLPVFFGSYLLYYPSASFLSPEKKLEAGAGAAAPKLPTPPRAVPAPARAAAPVPERQPSWRKADGPVVLPQFSGLPTALHTVARGETFGSIVRHYLPQTVFLTQLELEAAVHEANPDWTGRNLRPGQQLVIPGIQTAAIEEKPILIPKDSPIRGIYLTGLMAGSTRGLELVRRWKELGGNAVVFDIKDMGGRVNVPFDYPLAPKQRRPPILSLPKYTHFLHALGLHAIARIALFRDEQLAESHPELAVHSRHTKQPWRENGKLVWVDPSERPVQDYNLALAREAVKSGVDEIQFDYVRFPAEGDQADAAFAFQAQNPQETRSQVITAFLKRAYSELHSLGVLVSLDVFGVMAWDRPVDLAHTGQDIGEMARYCDVLSPMVYPSHFFGMDGYAKPGDAPEHFISESMARFQKSTAGSHVVLRPWLQAFGWHTKTYSPGYILTQIDVARENGGIGFLFWNARNDYSVPFLALSETESTAARLIRAGHRPARSNEETPASGSPSPSASLGGSSPVKPSAAPAHESRHTETGLAH